MAVPPLDGRKTVFVREPIPLGREECSPAGAVLQSLRILPPAPWSVHDGWVVTRSRNKDAGGGSFKQAFGEVKPVRGKSPKRVMPDPSTSSARVTGGRGRAGGPPEPLLVEREGNGIISGRRARAHASILHMLEDPLLEVDAEYDLHGFKAREAEREVLRFVESSQRSGKRWVRIIVGKGLHSKDGKGTLRDHIVGALSQRAPARYVLAFRTAPQRLGGTGALTVRLVDRL
jgi:DNA-nicking Smr family endonuclease